MVFRWIYNDCALEEITIIGKIQILPGWFNIGNREIKINEKPDFIP